MEVRYYSWSWDELPDAEGAAFAERWTYSPAGTLVERKRVPLEKRGRTFSTDPRARAIMAEETGDEDRLGTMSAPAWTRD